MLCLSFCKLWSTDRVLCSRLLSKHVTLLIFITVLYVVLPTLGTTKWRKDISRRFPISTVIERKSLKIHVVLFLHSNLFTDNRPISPVLICKLHF